MSVNKEKPHVFVLPEDRANEQLATGFHKGINRIRQMQVLPVAGGWKNVLSLFSAEHIVGMDRYPLRFMVLLIDLDGHEDRLDFAKNTIPSHLIERVFILSTLTEPEDLKRADPDTYENIGSKMAKDCRDGTNTIWDGDFLRHNTGELDRLSRYVRPILFESI